MKLIILDRDGTINHDSPDYIKTADEWQPLTGSIEAIAQLNRAGWRIVVATNQAGIGRGLFDIAALNAMHDKCRQLVTQAGGHIDAFFVCPHRPEDSCNCRKPQDGLYRLISARYGISAHQIVTVGDSLRDLLAAHSAGMQTWLVLTGNGEKTLAEGPLPPGTKVASNLAELAQKILNPEISSPAA